VAVFNHKDDEGNFGPNYRDIFPNPPEPDAVPNCAEAGVIGILPGIIGCLQANEVIKILAQIGEPLSGKLLVFDALSMQNRILKIRKDAANPLTGQNKTITKLIDYEIFCGTKGTEEEQKFESIQAKDLKELIENKEIFQLIDVRNSFECEVQNLKGLNIPLSELENSIDLIAKDKKVIVHCKSGARSKKAISILQEKYNFQNLFNLDGGIDAYLKL